MYTLINGSSKIKKSNSGNFLNYISDYLDKYIIYNIKKDNFEDIIKSINITDTIVLAFPLYVDSPNTYTLKLLDYMYDNSIGNKDLYVIINCGFKEGEHCITALNIIKNWCNKLNINYKGSILIGAGEIVGKTEYKFITKKARKKLKEFSLCIKDKKRSNDIITSMDLLGNKAYCFLANKSWTKKAKKNKLTKNDILKK